MKFKPINKCRGQFSVDYNEEGKKRRKKLIYRGQKTTKETRIKEGYLQVKKPISTDTSRDTRSSVLRLCKEPREQ